MKKTNGRLSLAETLTTSVTRTTQRLMPRPTQRANKIAAKAMTRPMRRHLSSSRRRSPTLSLLRTRCLITLLGTSAIGSGKLPTEHGWASTLGRRTSNGTKIISGDSGGARLRKKKDSCTLPLLREGAPPRRGRQTN